MLPFRRESRGVKRKNDYYYIIKLGIFQRKSEETRRHFPSGTFSPGRCRYPKIPYRYFLFCATRQRWFWVIDKKKKKVLCFLCKMPHKNRRIGKPAERLRRKATGPVIWQPAALPRSFLRASHQPFSRCGAFLFAVGAEKSNWGQYAKEDFYEKTIAQHDTGPRYDADHSASKCHNGVGGE